MCFHILRLIILDISLAVGKVVSHRCTRLMINKTTSLLIIIIFLGRTRVDIHILLLLIVNNLIQLLLPMRNLSHLVRALSF